ncbi:VanZ family protein [Streptomyces sp. NBC_01283]|uniref:VanZ family protein n=1 Tax=Streptomyces sp. NBC_01283 TaxID=2903812 RepID=UPI00352F1CDE|nr:VanZ family protein [Streptomyces sp. NBC_01283]
MARTVPQGKTSRAARTSRTSTARTTGATKTPEATQTPKSPKAAGRRSAPGTPPLSGWARAMAMLLAFAGTVVFAVLLARLTLEPSAASVPLTHSNLRPGDSIHDYLAQPAFRDTVKQLGGNIVLGLPFGMLLPVLVPRARGLIRVTAVTALVMLLVELAQGFLVTGRAFDVDDVLLNTTGAVLGYLLIGRRLGRAVHPRRRHWWHRFTKRSTAAAD